MRKYALEDGMCPRCDENARAPGQAYCKPCKRAYAREQRGSEARIAAAQLPGLAAKPPPPPPGFDERDRHRGRPLL